MQYYLATTGISQIWDKDKKLLLLGPWCLTGENNKKLLEAKEYQVVLSPWKPAYKIKEAADYCYGTYEILLPLLAMKLNSLHKVSFPDAYWRVLIGPWLMYFIGIFYERYTRLENCARNFADFYTHVLPAQKCNMYVTNTSDFLDNKVNSDFYNFKLFSFIARDIFPQQIKEIDFEVESHDSEENIVMGYSWKGKIFNKLLEKLNLIFRDYFVLTDMYHLSYGDMLLLKLKTGVKGLGFLNFDYLDISSPDDYSPEVRNELSIESAKDKFSSLLCKVIPHAIPICYVEKYGFYRESIGRHLAPVKAIGSAVGWYFNERFKFFAAEAVAGGARLIDFQHGGNYGMSLSMPLENIASEKDIFFSWGWGPSEEGKIRNLPSVHLSRLKNSYRERSNRVLFIGMAMPRYHYVFTSWLFPEDMVKYLEDKKALLGALSPEIKNKILYRPYFTDFGWQEKNAIKEVSPNAKFLLGGKATDWMRKVKLVIVDHPHTSFLEALTINVPLILYWDHDVYLMRPQAEPYFERLREAGILYKDPLSAANKINEVFTDTMGWWLSDKVQEARVEFCEHLAYARKSWPADWSRGLRGIRI